MSPQVLYQESVELLKKLISIESISRQEDKTADVIQQFLSEKGIQVQRELNNVWVYNKNYKPSKPTILLNSHHDTVKPNTGWTKDPFKAVVEDEKLFGLGSNDAGAALVSLLAAFIHFYDKENLKYNIVFAATAEEEISGRNGIEMIISKLGEIDFAIVGEPTQMQLAIAEKGLLVLDCKTIGKSGHAAREEGENAIYKAIKDIEWFKTFQFPKVSEFLGPIKMTVTIIKSGSQHNVVPDLCEFTVDVRVTDVYTNEEVIEIIKKNVSSEVTPRSVRLKSSSISKDHSIVKAGGELGRKSYGSPTTSDQALINAPSLKMGPGDSARSHTADEFVYLREIGEGIELYIKMLEKVIF